jgi:hypothetical protein
MIRMVYSWYTTTMPKLTRVLLGGLMRKVHNRTMVVQLLSNKENDVAISVPVSAFLKIGNKTFEYYAVYQ